LTLNRLTQETQLVFHALNKLLLFLFKDLSSLFNSSQARWQVTFLYNKVLLLQSILA
jgi:hypothetical protein